MPSNIEDQLSECLKVTDTKQCVYGDSRYAKRWYFATTFQGSNLGPEQLAFNKAMFSARKTVE